MKRLKFDLRLLCGIWTRQVAQSVISKLLTLAAINDEEEIKVRNYGHTYVCAHFAWEV